MDASPVSNKPINLLKSSSLSDTNSISFLEFDYTNLKKILEFGRELFQMNSTIDNGENPANNKMLRVANYF